MPESKLTSRMLKQYAQLSTDNIFKMVIKVYKNSCLDKVGLGRGLKLMVLAAYGRSVARDNIRYFRFFLHMPGETNFISQHQNKFLTSRNSSF